MNRRDTQRPVTKPANITQRQANAAVRAYINRWGEYEPDAVEWEGIKQWDIEQIPPAELPKFNLKRKSGKGGGKKC